MNRTAEYVSLGHPDKTADYVSSALLDYCLKQDENVRYAVEVMIKGNQVVLGGEVTGKVNLDSLEDCVKQAMRDIGYDEKYAGLWQDDAINIQKLQINAFIGAQSVEIGQGVAAEGWGDQGVFVGYACQGEELLPRELFLARKLNSALYEKAKDEAHLGLDIKTQITLDEKGKVKTAIAAVPMRKDEDLRGFIKDVLGEEPEQIIVNGTGAYVCHSTAADCGVTGRKLACDFYSTAAAVGGGSPWTKDPSKADLTLNLFARQLAMQNLEDNDECFVYLSSCIGQSELPSAVVKTIKEGKMRTFDICPECKPKELIKKLRLNRPIYRELCHCGFVRYFDKNGQPMI